MSTNAVDKLHDAVARLPRLFRSDSLPQPDPGGPRPERDQIVAWIAARLAARLDTPMEEIDPDVPFSQYGLDSRNALRLAGELEHWLGCELPPTLVWDYPTIAQLAGHLVGQLGGDANQTAVD